MRTEDFNALNVPVPENDTIDAVFPRALGVEIPALRQLYREVFDDLDEVVYGVRWWANHLGTTRRILVSHHLVQCIRSVETNLVEASLHLLEATDYWARESDFHAEFVQRRPGGGLRYEPRGRASASEDLSRWLATAHVVGFARALGSTLDCLGASIVGVLALPQDLRFADFGRAQRALASARHPLQQAFAQRLAAVIAAVGPAGWLPWALALRNMYVHRGRRTHVWQLLPRPERLFGPDGQVIPRMMAIEQLPADPERSRPVTRPDGTQKPGLGKNSVRLIRATLSVMLADAVDDGLLRANPARDLGGRDRRKRVDSLSRAERQKKICPMTHEQLGAFLGAAFDRITLAERLNSQEEATRGPQPVAERAIRAAQRDAVLFLTLADTGLRPGEALGLQWEDIDSGARLLNVERAISLRELKATKTGESRSVTLTLRLADALSRWQAMCEADALAIGGTSRPGSSPRKREHPSRQRPSTSASACCCPRRSCPGSACTISGIPSRRICSRSARRSPTSPPSSATRSPRRRSRTMHTGSHAATRRGSTTWPRSVVAKR